MQMTKPALRERLAERIDAGNGALAQGDTQTAYSCYNEALAIQPAHPHVLHNLGTILFKQGSRQAGVDLYRTAADLAPDNDAFLASLLNGLGHMKLYREALRVAHERKAQVSASPHLVKIVETLSNSGAKALPPRNPKLASDETFLRIRKEFRKQPYEKIIGETRKLLADRPTAVAGWETLGVALAESGKPQEATACYRRMLAAAPQNETFTLGLARSLVAAGDIRAAVTVLKRFTDRIGFSHPVTIHLVDYLIKAEQTEAARELLDQTAPLKSNEPLRLCLLGSTYYKDRNYEEAEKCYLAALEAAPADPSIYANALNYFNQTTDDDRIAGIVDQAKANGIPFDDPVLSLLAGRTELRRKNYDVARKLLEQHYNPTEHTPLMLQRAFSLGDTNDRTGRHAAAFDNYRTGNKIREQFERSANRFSRNNYRARIQASSRILDRHENSADFRQAFTSTPSDDNLTFILSFPRSGTTLLDNILRSHTSVEVIEERPIITETIKEYAEKTGLNPKTNSYNEIMDNFFTSDVKDIRNIYKEKLEYYRDQKSEQTTHFVDKVPLNTIYIPHILKLFPDAKIIFALRHPCDTILSCFFQNFSVNDPNLFFTSIENTVELYDLVMKFWKRCVDLLPMDYRYVRYENLVADLNSEIAPVINTMGLKWEDGLNEFYNTAKQRRVINTASKNQVTQKLYSSSKGRWTSYAEKIAPHKETINKWLEYFEYDTI